MWNKKKLIKLLKTSSTYSVIESLEKNLKYGLIVRHDIDWSIDDAYNVFLSERENKINSTYYVRLTSDLYNVNSIKNRKILMDISNFSEVGLHFDSSIYKKKNLLKGFKDEVDQLSNLIGKRVFTFSNHIPSKYGVSRLFYKKIKNAYSNKIFLPKTYISDSRYEYIKDIEEYVRMANKKLIYFLSHPEYYIESKRSYKSIISRINKTYKTSTINEIKFNNSNFLKFK